MKKIILTLIFASLTNNICFGADTYKLDPLHTNLVWHADHFGFSNPSGKFTDVDGKIILDERTPQNSSVEVTIKMNSISTGFSKFDTHLKSVDFFEVEKFPLATFKSSSVRQSGKNNLQVTGTLTLKDIKKIITLNVKINKIGKNPVTQNKTIGMSINTTLKRSDFGINYGLPNIGNEVAIDIESEAIFIGSSDNSNKNEVSKWAIIDKKSKIEFSATQNNSSIKGEFKKFKGNINFDPNLLTKSSVEIEIDTTSLDISFAEALETAKNNSWLATSLYPSAIFKSNNFSAAPGKNNFIAKGTLELKGKTVPVTLNFNIKAINERYAYVIGSTILNRNDFNIGEKNVNKANGVGEEVVVNFEVQANKEM